MSSTHIQTAQPISTHSHTTTPPHLYPYYPTTTLSCGHWVLPHPTFHNNPHPINICINRDNIDCFHQPPTPTHQHLLLTSLQSLLKNCNLNTFCDFGMSPPPSHPTPQFIIARNCPYKCNPMGPWRLVDIKTSPNLHQFLSFPLSKSV